MAAAVMPRLRMRPATHALSSLPVRILALGGCAGLAALTLADPGATRMWSTPWDKILALVLAAPVLILGLRILSVARPFRLPIDSWLLIALAGIIVPVASALASPWRAPSLLLAAVPVSAVALFLILQDWLATEPERNLLQLTRGLAVGAALIATVSFGLWLIDALIALQTHPLVTVLTVWRNPHPLGHPNYTAGLMLLGLPWLLLSAWRDRGWRREVSAVAAVFALLNLFTSGSRGGLVGLAALGMGGIVLARLGWKRLTYAALGIVATVVLLAVANPRVRGMLAPADPAAEPNLSNLQRTAMLEAGALMRRDRPLLGWGPGATPLVYPHYRHALAGGAENVLQLHNTPVQVGAETGFAGLAVLLAFGALVVRHARRAPVAAVTLGGYGVFALTDFQLDVPVFAAALAALAALLAPSAVTPAARRQRHVFAGTIVIAGLLTALGRRDPAPALNVEALALARDAAQHDRAVGLLQRSLALNPDQEIAHFNLGWLLLISDPVAAEKHFLTAAHLVPDKEPTRHAAAARALALECLNDPLFLASPWWNVPSIAALRESAREEFIRMLDATVAPAASLPPAWRETQIDRLRSLAPRLGQISAGEEKAYRRDRVGYPVLMRNLDLPVPADLYDVREDPRFPPSVPFPLPSKGWLPSPQLLKLLDDPVT
jgi:O-antigen ligase